MERTNGGKVYRSKGVQPTTRWGRLPIINSQNSAFSAPLLQILRHRRWLDGKEMPLASLLAERDLLSGNTSHEARFALRERMIAERDS